VHNVGSAGDATHTGSFQHRFPIALPDGRKGVQPDLELIYDSNAPNGILGVGWVLGGLPAITRANYGKGLVFTGGENNWNDTFFFLPNGWGTTASSANRLVKDDPTAARYMLSKDNISLFVPYGRCGSGPCHWVMHDGKGWIYYFGQSAASSHPALSYTVAPCAGASYSSVVCEPDNGSTTLNGPRGIQAWLLERVEDSYGNSFHVTYAGDARLGVRYPKSIAYTKHRTEATSSFDILFENETRQDFTPMPNRHQQRLKKLIVRSKNSEGSVTGGVRAYNFGYEESLASGRTRLISIEEEAGYVGPVAPANLPKLPPQTFEYENANPDEHPLGEFRVGVLSLARLEERNDFQTSLNWQAFSGDFNGDGRADVLRVFQGNTAYGMPDETVVYQTLYESAYGDSTGLSPVLTHLFATTGFAIDYVDHAHGTIQFAPHFEVGDINGDGFDDLINIHVYATHVTIHYMLGSAEGISQESFTQVPSFDHETVNPISWPLSADQFYIETGDVNGDQKMDLVIVPFYPFEPNSGGRGIYSRVLLGDESGLSGPHSFILSPPAFRAHGPLVPRPAWSRGLSITDVNGDEKGDLVWSYSTMGGLVQGESPAGIGEVAFAYALGTDIAPRAIASKDGSFRSDSTMFFRRIARGSVS
jgi:hypothetical protein